MLPDYKHLRVYFFCPGGSCRQDGCEGLCPARQLHKALSDSAFAAPYTDSSVIIPTGMQG